MIMHAIKVEFQMPLFRVKHLLLISQNLFTLAVFCTLNSPPLPSSKTLVFEPGVESVLFVVETPSESFV